MRLVEPSAQWQSSFLEMAREFQAAGEQRFSPALRDFDAYLRKVEAGRRGKGLPEGWIPGNEFWSEHDGEIIACARLRLGLTPDLEHEGGHIGYDVRPSMRRRGHGTALLQLALLEARALGIERVRMTCDDDNIGSIKIIERNGGTLAGRGVSKQTGKTIRQYWIEAQCVLCSIAGGGRTPELVAFRDAQTAVFPCLHQQPRNRGHMLVVPIQHVAQIYDLGAELAGPLMTTLVRVAAGVKAAFGADGVTVRQNNERHGGQDVFHVHFHVIPRFADDEFNSGRNRYPYGAVEVPLEERVAQAARLSEALRDLGEHSSGQAG